MAAKTHEEFCKREHRLTTGHCHIKIECEECKRIWNAAIEAAEGVRERAANNERDEIAALIKELEDITPSDVDQGGLCPIIERMRRLSPIS